MLDFLVKEGDSLPKKGQKTYKAAESLKAGSNGVINFKLWEGDIDDPVTDNCPIGLFMIRGHDFESGVISAGADLICEREASGLRQHLVVCYRAEHRRYIQQHSQLLFA